MCVENVNCGVLKQMGALHPLFPALERKSCAFERRDEHGKRKKVFRGYRFRKVHIIIREMLFVCLM